MPMSGISMAGALVVGIHDQFVSYANAWVFSGRSGGEDESSPLGVALGACAAIAVASWPLIRRQMRKYMTFEFRPQFKAIQRGVSYLIADLIQGRPRIKLKNTRLKIVACNMEKGQYERGSGSNRRTVSFSNPVNGVCLYDKLVAEIPAKSQVTDFYLDEFTFDAMFQQLFPPMEITAHHGIATHWEIQLLVDDLVDQELIGPTSSLHYEDFIQG